MSPTSPRRVVFTHSGWREIEGRHIYLSASGAIGAEGAISGVETELPGNLALMSLPDHDDRERLRLAVGTALDLLNLAPFEVGTALLAAVARAPLGPSDFAIWLSGRSGAFKSELAAILQGFWGSGFRRTALPGQWNDTANRLEELLFHGKDALCVIDDYAPAGSHGEIQDLRRKVGQVLRAVGNGAGRGKLFSDSSMRPVHAPRGLLVATGEEPPTGFSIAARTLLLEVRRGDIPAERLAHFQRARDTGLLAYCQAGYLRYLASDLKKMLKNHEERSRELLVLGGPGMHARTPLMIAELGAALDLWLAFAVSAGALSNERRRDLWAECWRGLQGLAWRQEEAQQSEAPEERALALLGDALAARQCHLVDTAQLGQPPKEADRFGWRRDSSNRWQPGGPAIGWVDGSGVYLDPGPAFEEVSRRAAQRGSVLGVTQRTLGKRLAEAGLLLFADTGRTTYSKRCGGTKRNTWAVAAARLVGEAVEPEAGEDSRPEPLPKKLKNEARELLEAAASIMRSRAIDAATGDELASWLSAGNDGRPMSAKAVAAAFATLGLSSKQTWRNGRNVRCYYRTDLILTLGKRDEELPLDAGRPDGDTASGEDAADWYGEYEEGEACVDD